MQDEPMLSVRVTASREVVQDVRERLSAEPTVSDLLLVAGTGPDGDRDILFFELARESANDVMELLRTAGVPASGSIVVAEPLTVVSDAAAAAERKAPGHPADGVVWARLADQSREDARPSWVFFVFLLLATLIAGIGRVLDQPMPHPFADHRLTAFGLRHKRCHGRFGCHSQLLGRRPRAVRSMVPSKWAPIAAPEPPRTRASRKPIRPPVAAAIASSRPTKRPTTTSF